MNRPIGASLAALAVVAAWAAPALAAPVYLSSEPPKGAQLEEAPDEVRVMFSEPLDPGSNMLVRDECGDRIDDKNVEVLANEITVGIATKPKGVYKVFYLARGIGGATGTSEGDYTFEVVTGPACVDSVQKQPQHHHQGHGMGGGDGKNARHEGHGSEGHDDEPDHLAAASSDHNAHTDGPSGMASGHDRHRPSNGGPVAPDTPGASAPAPTAGELPPFAADDGARSPLGNAFAASLALALGCGILGGLLLRVIDEK